MKKSKDEKTDVNLKSDNKEETSLVDVDYERKKLFKKGINLMADEKLEDAVEVFENALKYDPKHVETLLKLGYTQFHLDDHAESLRIYDRVLDIDVTNAEAWNLKSLVHYEQKNYARALDSVEKAIDSDPTYAMAWYNKACYLSILHQVTDSLEALKRSIEIDVKNARRAVKDRDFINVRIEEGFKRIIEVVVLESVRQGYHTIGAIVWTTFLDTADLKVALRKLMEKGLIVVHEKRELTQKVPTYDLAPDIAKKVPTHRRSLLGMSNRKLPASITNLKELSQTIQYVKVSIEEEDIEKTINYFDTFIDSKKCGQQMIDQFFEQHREIRLWKVRLKDRGLPFFQDNKQKMITLFDNIEMVLTKQLRSEVT